jgi:hypothetical protein
VFLPHVFCHNTIDDKSRKNYNNIHDKTSTATLRTGRADFETQNTQSKFISRSVCYARIYLYSHNLSHTEICGNRLCGGILSSGLILIIIICHCVKSMSTEEEVPSVVPPEPPVEESPAELEKKYVAYFSSQFPFLNPFELF